MKSWEIPSRKSLVWRWFLSQWQKSQWLEIWKFPVGNHWFEGDFNPSGKSECRNHCWRWNIPWNPSDWSGKFMEIPSRKSGWFPFPTFPTSRCTLVATNLATCSGASPRSNAPSTSATRWDSGRKTVGKNRVISPRNGDFMGFEWDFTKRNGDFMGFTR